MRKAFKSLKNKIISPSKDKNENDIRQCSTDGSGKNAEDKDVENSSSSVSSSFSLTETNTIAERIKQIKLKRFKISDFDDLDFPKYAQCVMKEKELYFIKICRLCCVQFSFDDHKSKKYVRARRAKTSLLFILHQYAKSKTKWLSSDCVDSLIELANHNLFLPSLNCGSETATDELRTQSILLSEWKQKRVVYDLINILIINSDTGPRITERFASPPFLQRLIRRTSSTNPFEQSTAQRVIHKTYAQVGETHRKKIRDAVSNVLEECILSDEKISGVNELLFFIASFAAGYVVPLKQEHKEFFNSKILILVACPYFCEFVGGFAQCAAEFIRKDKELALKSISAVLKIPLLSPGELCLKTKGDPLKSLALSLNCILPLTAKQIAEYDRTDLADEVVRQFSRCLNDQRLSITELMFPLLEGNYIQTMITLSKDRSEWILYQSLLKNGEHWNPEVRQRSVQDCNNFRESLEIKGLSEKFESEAKEEKEYVSARLCQWETLLQSSNS